MTFKGKVYVPDGSEVPHPPTQGLALAESIFTRVTTFYATEGERNTETAVPGKMSAAQKLGMRCWVDSRKAFYFFDGQFWWPETQTRMLADAFVPEKVDVAGVSPGDLVLTGPYILPGSVGNRRIQMSGCAFVTNAAGYTGDAFPRIMLILNNQIAQQQSFLLSGNAIDLRVQWTGAVAAGSTIFPKLRGLVAAGSPCSFYGRSLQVFDLGPAD